MLLNTEANTRIPVSEAIQQIASSEDRIVAWHFFMFFSRFEYALKRCDRYLTVNAQPNWDKFASDHANQFDNLGSPALKTAVAYIRENPPRKPLQQAGNLSWSEPQVYDTREPLLIRLLRMVRCIRQANRDKHGIDFVEAQSLWLDEMFVEVPARTEDEPRFLAVGMISGKHWTAIITYRGEKIRIISVRRARVEEVEIY